jgi:hypothetical protein
MVPIEKNIRVVDVFNNDYEPTYPKRAKGLVKNGRARLVNATTICLTDPPIKKLEGIKMFESINPVEAIQSSTNSKTNARFSIEYTLEQIENIAAQTEYLNSAVEALRQMSDGENAPAYSPGNEAGKAKAQSIADTVRSREATNQQLLRIYEKIYDDLKPVKPAQPKREVDVAILDSFVEAASDMSPGEKAKFLSDLINKVI